MTIHTLKIEALRRILPKAREERTGIHFRKGRRLLTSAIHPRYFQGTRVWPNCRQPPNTHVYEQDKKSFSDSVIWCIDYFSNCYDFQIDADSHKALDRLEWNKMNVSSSAAAYNNSADMDPKSLREEVLRLEVCRVE